MKILAIGNSFSQDAARYIKEIADSSGVDVKIVNLYIGGCSLKMHTENIEGDYPAYDYELNGKESALCKISIKDALMEDDWDIVTVQQVSNTSGIEESYEPYGSIVLDTVKKYAPNAKIYLHKTWSYEIDSNHGAFVNYHNSQIEMYNCINKAASGFASNHNIEIIPSGDVIQELRKIPDFDYSSGGLSLNRDGFHMSWEYGRFAVGLTWFATLLNGDIDKVTFKPINTEEDKIDLIKQTVKAVCR